MFKWLPLAALWLSIGTAFAQAPGEPQANGPTAADTPEMKARMETMHARMEAMQALMQRIQATEDPAEKQRLMQEQMQLMRESMKMQEQMMMGHGMGGMAPDHPKMPEGHMNHKP